QEKSGAGGASAGAGGGVQGRALGEGGRPLWSSRERALRPAGSPGHRKERVKPEVILVGVTILWGSTFAVTKSIVHEAPPLVYLPFRFGLAAAVMGTIYFRRLPRSRRALVDGAILGLLNSSGLVLQVFGQVYTSASKSAFITSLNTPLVP